MPKKRSESPLDQMNFKRKMIKKKVLLIGGQSIEALYSL